MSKFSIKGDIVFTQDNTEFTVLKDGYVLCENAVCKGTIQNLEDSPEFAKEKIIDYTGKLIIPGFADTHTHAPQYGFRAMGLDMPLMDWLQTYTFPEESHYSNIEYAKISYDFFVNNLKNSATTRAVIFGTEHLEATEYLARTIDNSGICALVGKVNMDQNACPDLNENTEKSLLLTEQYIKNISNLKNVKPIITPRFVPSCTSELLESLGELAKKYNLPIQSHLSENDAEIAFVKELYPNVKDYANVYEQFGLLNDKTIMAHCVHLTDNEIELLKGKGSFVSHCPQSNTNLMSGISPISTYLKRNLCVTMGSDIAGGCSLNMFRAGADAIYASKLRYALLKQQGIIEEPLTLPQLLFMLTKSASSFFEKTFGVKTGSFENGYAFDALVIDDSSFTAHSENGNNFGIEDSLVFDPPIERRIERLFYLVGERHIIKKYVNGVQIK